MENKTYYDFRVLSFETDLNSRMKPFFMQNRIQEAAYMGSEFCGVSYRDLRRSNLFWALSRVHYEVSQWPAWGDDVTIETWSRGHIGPFWHRNLRMFRNGDRDNPLMLATTAWTILDLGDRSIYRGDLEFDHRLHCEDETLPLCSKVTVPKDVRMEEAGSRIAAFSDLDLNGHVNNCVYTQWAMDVLPYEYVKSHILSDFQVSFYHEVKIGERVDFRMGRRDGTYWLEGLVGTVPCFVIRLGFAI